ncbi:MAG: hypothetical protein WCO44_11880 [Bacteroidota bacterium]
MNKHFCHGKGIVIGSEFIWLKEKNTRLSYDAIRSVSIRKARLHRAGLLYIIAGMTALAVILGLIMAGIIGLLVHPENPAIQGLFNRRHGISLLLFLFIGGPAFIISWIRKYFRKHMMLVIRWKHRDFRTRISELKINVQELKVFLSSRVEHLEFEPPDAATTRSPEGHS